MLHFMLMAVIYNVGIIFYLKMTVALFPCENL